MPTYEHWLKVPTRRNVMNTGERWLRQGRLESGEAIKGKNMNQAVAMSVDHDNATIGVAFSKPFLGGRNVGNMALNMGDDKQLPSRTHLSKKSSGGTSVISDGDMKGAEDLENDFIVNDLKQRRSLHELHITMGLGEEA